MCTILFILSTIVCRSIPASFSKLDCRVFPNRILWVSVLPPLCVHRIHPHKLFLTDQSRTSHFHTRHWQPELAFKFSIVVHKNHLHQGKGHPIENFANVINESNILKIQVFHQNCFLFLQQVVEKRHASNFKRDLFYFQLTSTIPQGIQRIRTHIGCFSFISAVLSDTLSIQIWYFL